MQHQILSKQLRRHLIFGANTDVGKTIVSAGLVRASAAAAVGDKSTFYLKPLQTGVNDNGNGGDAEFVQRMLSNTSLPKSLTNNSVHCRTLFQWKDPVSPHLAARIEDKPISDSDVLSSIRKNLLECDGTTFIETAGGALSPSSCSPLNNAPYHAHGKMSTSSWGWSTQADLYKSIRLPVVLVGDGRLGGIACTLSTLESLIVRGYDVHSIVLIDEHEQGCGRESNTVALREYLSRSFPMRAGDGTSMLTDVDKDIIALPPLPPLPQPLDEWYSSDEVIHTFAHVNNRLHEQWSADMDRLNEMRGSGRNSLWWPFTQHGTIKDDKDITLIDGAIGDYYSVLQDTSSNNGELKRTNLFDSCASWWTQGVGHGETSIALATAAAAGRYGHVIFPDAVHNPSVALAEYLVGPKGPGNGWASRVFYSDDGSTAIEVGIKMAMKKFASTHFQRDTTKSNPFGPSNTCLTVLAQEDCYHGDTLGCMDVAVPSIFNEGQHPWYSPKGLFLQTPTLGYVDGVVEVIIPTKECSGKQGEIVFKSISDAIDVNSRLASTLYVHYLEQIQLKWNAYEKINDSSEVKTLIGCVLIEPLLMGAGGMKFVDPLWQRALIDEARRRDVPIIFDEIAAGLYRLGVSSCKDILCASPDIACYAKLLTGGVVPLSVTLASEEVFDAFLGDTKTEALLHGHSYTAHPIGCLAALHALESYDNVLAEPMTSYFNEDQVKELSLMGNVSESFALGTVLAVKLLGEGGYGALSTSKPVIEKLRQNGVYARPLGNVVYIMVSPFTSKDECSRLIHLLRQSL